MPHNNRKGLKFMKKNELIELANKGVVQIGGYNAEIIIRDSAGNNGDFIEIFIEPINEYTTKAVLGEKWVEFVTDEECTELENGIKKIYDKMASQAEICNREPRVLKYHESDPKILVCEKEKTYKIIQYEDHFEIVVLYKGCEPDYPLNVPVEINGKVYKPVWSWWLDKGCYMGKYTENDMGGGLN